MTANRSNRRWQNPSPPKGEQPVLTLGSQCANSPSRSRAIGTIRRPNTREQSILPPEIKPLANEEESIPLLMMKSLQMTADLALIDSNNLAQWLCAIVHVGGPFWFEQWFGDYWFIKPGPAPSKKCAKHNLRYLWVRSQSSTACRPLSLIIRLPSR